MDTKLWKILVEFKIVDTVNLMVNACFHIASCYADLSPLSVGWQAKPTFNLHQIGICLQEYLGKLFFEENSLCYYLRKNWT